MNAESIFSLGGMINRRCVSTGQNETKEKKDQAKWTKHDWKSS